MYGIFILERRSQNVEANKLFIGDCYDDIDRRNSLLHRLSVLEVLSMTRTERLAERLKKEIERTHGVEIDQGEVLNILRVHMGENNLCLTNIREMGD